MVALQGTFETFAFPDVLRLLASTSKTGQLHIEASRARAGVWFGDGRILAAEVSASPLATDVTEVVFEILRFEEGKFVFEEGSAPDGPGEPIPVADALSGAEVLLEEWARIEAVVESPAAFVCLRRELAADEITLDAETWRKLVAVGSGWTISALGRHMELTGLAVRRLVKELLELGVVEVGDRREALSEPILLGAARARGGAEAEGARAGSGVKSGVAEASGERGTDRRILTVVGDPDVMGSAEDRESAGTVAPSRVPDASDPGRPDPAQREPGGGPVGGEPAPIEAAASSAGGPPDPAEIARQLANLSPKAARAVAAAAKATTNEEREAALADVDDADEPINRGLLLKFLGSVNG